MIEELQDLVEGLAQELKRSVAIDDPGLRLIVSSSHFEEVDEARVDSLVGRRVSRPLRDYLMRSGVQTWREPTRVPRNTEVGLYRGRFCFPLRSRYELLGFLWLIDDGTIDDDTLAATGEVAELIREFLIQKAQSDVSADIEIEALLLGLFVAERANRAQVARDIIDLGLFRHATHFSTYVVSVARDGEPRGSEQEAVAVRRALAGATKGRLREFFAYAVATEESVLVRGHRNAPQAAELTSFAMEIHAELARSDPPLAARTTIGVGTVVMSLEDVETARSQANTAARIASLSGDTVASWGHQPLATLLASVLRERIRRCDLPAAILKVEEQSDETLRVISTFLDNAGNVARTGDDLHMHRTTVYYRLGRFQEATGIDLDQGDLRLLLHLWLKIRHMVTLD